MPQLNRDKESLYPPGKLSVWFLGTSGLLVGALVWMLAGDFIRPWKSVQRAYFQRQAEVLTLQREKDEADIRSSERKAGRLKELKTLIEDAQRALDEPETARKLAEWQAEADAKKADMEDADRNLKMAKGDYSAKRNELEFDEAKKRKEATVEEDRRELNEFASAQSTWEGKRLTAIQEMETAKNKIEDRRRPLRVLVLERDALQADLAATRTSLSDARARTEANQWRNLPVADIVSPSIKIEKVVLDQIHEDYNFATSPKVDMCMTCHRGVDNATMSEEKVAPLLRWFVQSRLGDKAWEKVGDLASERLGFVKAKESGEWVAPPSRETWRVQPSGRRLRDWLAGRPSLLDVLSAEEMATAFGGPVKEKDKDGHEKTRESDELRAWRDRHLDGKSLEAGGRDLLAPFAIRAVEWAHPHLDLMVGSTSAHPITASPPKASFGCTSCHQGQGRRLDFTRATHTPDDVAPPAEDVGGVDEKTALASQKRAWEEEYHWEPAELVDYPMLPARHVEGQCYKCHAPSVEMRPRIEALTPFRRALLGDGTPVLDKNGKPVPRAIRKDGEPVRDREGMILAQAVDSKGVPQSTADGQPVLDRALAPDPVDGSRAAAEDRWHPEVYERGAEAIRRIGCQGCHLVREFGKSPGYPRRGFGEAPTVGSKTGVSEPFTEPADGSVTAAGNPKVGPDLTHISDKTTIDWVLRWVEAPTAFRIDTRMPAFYRHVLHHNFVPIPGPDGKPREETVILEPGDKDRAQIDVEVLALSSFLVNGQKHPKEEGYDPARADSYPTPPAGDVAKGRELFYRMSCYGCHLGPDDRAGSGLPERTLHRFDGREDLPPGPRLTSVGSKVNEKWLYAWLAEPHHYNSVSKMPNPRWRDETSLDGKTVTRSADQQRADVVAYLMTGKDPVFMAREVPDPTSSKRWSEEHKRVLTDFYMEWYGKNRVDPNDPEPDPKKKRKLTITVEEAAAEAARMLETDLGGMLVAVGKKLVGYRGCYGCHNIEGFERDQPIGKELSEEGSQDLHKFDFGILGPPLGHPEMEETRWNWIEQKLRQPRLYDLHRVKPRWADKLRMPKFNLRDDERMAVASVVLGFVKDKIKPGAMYPWPDDMRKVQAGRAVVERYGCNQCHTIERRMGVLTGEQLDLGNEMSVLPPNLYGEGHRVKAEWLFKFLKVPTDIRPNVRQRMPMFRMTDDEAAALVDYFEVLSGRSDRISTDPLDRPLETTPYDKPVTIKPNKKGQEDKEYVVHNLFEEGKALFETMGCVECHLPKGTPGVDPEKGGIAPSFGLSHDRLRREWMSDMVHQPTRQIWNAKMTEFWPVLGKKSKEWTPDHTRTIPYPMFKVSARANKDATPDQVADEQMDTLVRYILHHYEAPSGTTSAPPAPAAGTK